MIYTVASTKNSDIIENIQLEKLDDSEIDWYWVDIQSPNEEEALLLDTYFNFHGLAIEDCLNDLLERPKIEVHESYIFIVLHALNRENLEPLELEIFFGKNYIVSFSKNDIREISNVRKGILNNLNLKEEGHSYIFYKIVDKIVDYYYPSVYKIEDFLDQIETTPKDKRKQEFIDLVFETRSELMKLRRIINPMQELLYTIINSNSLIEFKYNRLNFRDTHDHILRLWDIIEASRYVTSDIRDNYLSINSHRMNKIITTLTIISSIFIPLTFIVGVYGMNFDYMPELRWRYGYFLIWGFMIFIIISMIGFFKKMGWFETKK